MAVYSTFDGMSELVKAVIDLGYRELGTAQEASPKTDDPVADIFRLALVHRDVTRRSPHLYDLMFGLSTRSAYRAIEIDVSPHRGTKASACGVAYGHLVNAAQRLVESGRFPPDDPRLIAARLWTCVHGFISLELAGHFGHFEDCVERVLLPLGFHLPVGHGDDPQRAARSIASAIASMKASRAKKARVRMSTAACALR